MAKFTIESLAESRVRKKAEKLVEAAARIAREKRSEHRELNPIRNEIEDALDKGGVRGKTLPRRDTKNLVTALNALDDLVDDYETRREIAEKNAGAAAREEKKRKRSMSTSEEDAPAKKRAKKVPTKAPDLPSQTTKWKVNNRRIYNGERKSMAWYNGTRATIYQAGTAGTQDPRKRVCAERGCNIEVSLDECHIDHIKDWADYQDIVDSVTFCYEGWHFSGQYQDDMRKAYNRNSNLQVMCDTCNTRKNGTKGRSLNKPQPLHACEKGEACRVPKLTT